MIVNPKRLLNAAQKRGYAIGAFNTSDLEITQAIVEAASEMRSPVILQTSPAAIKYAGLKELSCIIRNAAGKVKTPVAMHLDHGEELRMVKQCLANSYTSIMIDGSYFSFSKNVELTRKAVLLSHKAGVPVEAELGRLKQKEDSSAEKKQLYTDPAEAKRFMELTNADSLAIAIGTSHGAYKFKGKEEMDFKRLKEIREMVNAPLVLHGASGVPKSLLKLASMYGAKLEGAHGVSDASIKKAVKLGICKVNIDTDLRLAFTSAVRKELFEKPEEFNPREIMSAAKEAIKSVVRKKMRLLGSEATA